MVALSQRDGRSWSCTFVIGIGWAFVIHGIRAELPDRGLGQNRGSTSYTGVDAQKGGVSAITPRWLSELPDKWPEDAREFYRLCHAILKRASQHEFIASTPDGLPHTPPGARGARSAIAGRLPP